MDFDEYQRLALRTENRALSQRDLKLKSALGLAGEAGETAEVIKKLVFHDRAFLPEKLREEIGDVLWYVAALADALGYKLSDCARENIAKLEKRYPSGHYTHEQCAARADEKEEHSILNEIE